MKADVKLNKLAKLQLHMLNVRQTTALTVRHYANVILWLKFLPMGLKGLSATCVINYRDNYCMHHIITWFIGCISALQRNIDVLV